MTEGGAPRIRLGAGREFDMIRAFLGEERSLPAGVVLGPGDDATTLDGGWVLSTDLAVEDVHFRRGWLSDREIGYRATAASLSDLAAMAAEPIGVLVSLAAPRGARVDVAAVQQGVTEAAASVGAQVIGGDLSRSPGPLFLDVVVLGRTEQAISRAGARVGDELWVSGTLGTGAAALLAWEEGGRPSEPLRRRFARPTPRIGLARALATAGVPTAMLDLSDGLAGDAGHLAAASGVGLVIVDDSIPVDEEVLALLGRAGALGAALHGGEDYELLFTAPAGAVEGLGSVVDGVPLTRIGRVVAPRARDDGTYDDDAPPLVLREGADGTTRPVGRGGFDHWSV
jgi:thiamine-monophosphate kinase